MNLSEVLIKPLITEKSTSQRESGIYIFRIHPLANKILVKQAVEKFFSVKVDKVRVLVRKPKIKTNFRTGKKNKKSAIRKAYVFIKSKSKIPELDA